MHRVEVKKLVRNFGARKVLREVSFSLTTGESMAVTGINGSGKTTLLRILAGLTAANRGTVEFFSGDKLLDKAGARELISYVGPEMTLYDQLTAAENLEFFAKMRGLIIDSKKIESILNEIGLEGRGTDFYGAYSSGMKQRLKYSVALLNNPAFLLLDEPTANLDEAGKKVVIDIIKNQKNHGIAIIATNEKEEYGFAEKLHQLGG